MVAIQAKRAPDVKEIHIVWMTTGLGCDGDSVSITAATQPSIEDVVMGAIPGLPKVHLHNPVLAYEVGDDFMKYWYQAEEGRLDPLYVANEGKLIAVVPPDDAAGVLDALQAHPLGRDAALVGTVVADHPGMVILRSRVGGERVVTLLAGEQLPRIC